MNRYFLSCFAVAILFAGCAVGPDYSNYDWHKPGGTIEEQKRYLAEANVHAIEAYPDPISQAQINSEPMNAPSIREAKRNQVILNFMASKGWSFLPNNHN